MRNFSSIPNIDVQGAPDEERQTIRLVNSALVGLQSRLQNIVSAVHLFDYCIIQNSLFEVRRESAFSKWQFVAARDCVMSVWNFRKGMSAANDMANKSTFISPQLNRDALGQAHEKFKAGFPEFESIRHAVAHAGELSKNPKTHTAHAFSGSYESDCIKIKNSTNMMIQDTLLNRRYTCTHDGKIVYCDISGETIQKINEVLNLFYAGFVTPNKVDGAQPQV